MRSDHLLSCAWCVVRLVWRVKKGGNEYSQGNSKGAGVDAIVGHERSPGTMRVSERRRFGIGSEIPLRFLRRQTLRKVD